jgi:hypothetical protein
MNIKNLILLEYSKNKNKAALIIIILFIYTIISGFWDGIYIKNNISIDMSSIPTKIKYFDINFYYVFIIFAAYIVISITRDIKNNIILKHIAEGLSKSQYLISKFLHFLLAIIIFQIIFINSLYIISIFYDVSFSNFLSILSLYFFALVFLGFLLYGLIGFLFALIFKNSLISILILIAQYFLELSLSVIDAMILKTNLTNYLPTTIIRNILHDDKSSIYLYFILFSYSLIIMFIINYKFKKTII